MADDELSPDLAWIDDELSDDVDPEGEELSDDVDPQGDEPSDDDDPQGDEEIIDLGWLDNVVIRIGEQAARPPQGFRIYSPEDWPEDEIAAKYVGFLDDSIRTAQRLVEPVYEAFSDIDALLFGASPADGVAGPGDEEDDIHCQTNDRPSGGHTAGPLTTFELFPRLSVELQLMIWERSFQAFEFTSYSMAASAEGFDELAQDLGIPALSGNFINTMIRDGPVASWISRRDLRATIPTLYVCQQSRKVAIRAYGSQPPQKHRMYVNPQLDTLRLCADKTPRSSSEFCQWWTNWGPSALHYSMFRAVTADIPVNITGSRYEMITVRMLSLCRARSRPAASSRGARGPDMAEQTEFVFNLYGGSLHRIQDPELDEDWANWGSLSLYDVVNGVWFQTCNYVFGDDHTDELDEGVPPHLEALIPDEIHDEVMAVESMMRVPSEMLATFVVAVGVALQIAREAGDTDHDGLTLRYHYAMQ